jgi:hypothetical protein
MADADTNGARAKALDTATISDALNRPDLDVVGIRVDDAIRAGKVIGIAIEPLGGSAAQSATE